MSPTPKDSDLINPVSVDKLNEKEKEIELAPPPENHVRGMSPHYAVKCVLTGRTLGYETSKGRIIGMSPSPFHARVCEWSEAQTVLVTFPPQITINMLEGARLIYRNLPLIQSRLH
jgi:hypothetical protein